MIRVKALTLTLSGPQAGVRFLYIMPYNPTSGTWELDPLLQKLTAEKKAGRELQLRKHDDWTENYELYRNKVQTNRLTQRQAVNIPLMKETIKTVMARIDDLSEVEWQELAGDEEKELVYQEVWNDAMRQMNAELVDVIDKKNVLLYGFSMRKLNLTSWGVDITIPDVYDTYIDPLTNPWDLETAKFITHQNIFRTVRDILADDKYSDEGKDQLKLYVNSPQGILQSGKTKEQWEAKMERLRAMGVGHKDFPLFAGGDTLCNLTEHYTTVWNEKQEKWERRVVVYADDKIELMNERLIDLIGVECWPFVRWSEDPETNDVYPDSLADTVRTPNKVINVWFSQLLENRTLRNFNMHWFLPSQGYTPQTYTPGPGMMLPAPPGEDINQVIKPVEVDALNDTLDAIAAVTQIVERASGATAIEKGTGEQGQQTLGEIQVLVGKAQERTTAMAKFYRLAWYETAKKWDKLMHANAPKLLKLYKRSSEGKIYPKRVYAGDWVSKVGYEPIVRSSSEQEASNIQSIQKFQFIISQFPNNPVLRKIAQKRMLEIVDLTPEELRQVEEAEDAMAQMPMQTQATEVPQVGAPTGEALPTQPQPNYA